jgi:hypothetical protein
MANQVLWDLRDNLVLQELQGHQVEPEPQGFKVNLALGDLSDQQDHGVTRDPGEKQAQQEPLELQDK